MYFEDSSGAVILRDDLFDLKINSDRKIYMKPESEQQFKLVTPELVPKGFTYQQKKEVLINLNQRIRRNAQLEGQ